MRAFTAVLTVSLLFPLCTLTAQQPPPVALGERVRVTYDCGDAAMYMGGRRMDCADADGTTNRLTRDTLILVAGENASQIVVPLASVTRLAVQRGRKSNVGTGAAVGAFLLGVPGGVVAAIICNGSPYDVTCSPASSILIGAAAGGAVGAVLGAAVGALSKTDRWEEVPLDRLRVSFVPKRDGVSFRLRIAF